MTEQQELKRIKKVLKRAMNDTTDKELKNLLRASYNGCNHLLRTINDDKYEIIRLRNSNNKLLLLLNTLSDTRGTAI